MKMTEAEFQRIYRYVKLHYGIDMSKKKEIMTGRLENYVVAHGYASYDAFMNALETDPTGHMEKRLIGMLTTNHTFFMREFEHMEYLSRVVLPELSWSRRRGGSIRQMRSHPCRRNGNGAILRHVRMACIIR